jgi:hypothetical protein
MRICSDPDPDQALPPSHQKFTVRYVYFDIHWEHMYIFHCFFIKKVQYSCKVVFSHFFFFFCYCFGSTDLPKLVICAEDLMVGGQLWCLGQLSGQGVDPLRHPTGGSVVRLNKPGNPQIMSFSQCFKSIQVDPLRYPAGGSIVRLNKPEIFKLRASVCVCTVHVNL